MQPATIRLPHSGLLVPTTEYTVTSYKSLRAVYSDGVAFVATLRRHGKIVGDVTNEGRGGPTTFHPRSVVHGEYAAARAALDAYAAHCRNERGEPPMVETVLDDLVTEYEIGRDIAKAAKRGNHVVRMMQDHLWDAEGEPMNMPSMYSTMDVRSDDVARLRAELLAAPDLAPHELAWWQLWDAPNNRWVDVTDRPAHLAAADN